MKRKLLTLFGILLLLVGFISIPSFVQAETTADTYFTKNSKQYNQELAKGSLGLSALAHDTKELGSKLKGLGFSEKKINYYNYTDSGRTSGVAFALAQKEIKVKQETYTLIAVVLRGTNGKEWYGNFNISNVDLTDENAAALLSKVTVHSDFQKTEQEVKRKLKAYVKGIQGNIKFWITGHSRGAAIANLLAADLTKSEDIAKKEDIYAYTFATPNVTTKPINYNNIFNFVNSEDFVTYAPLPNWGFDKHGITICFQDKLGELSKKPAVLKKIKKEFKKLTGVEFQSFQGGSKETKTFVQEAAKLSDNVTEYYLNTYAAGDQKISLYQYLMMGADLLAGDKAEKETAMQQMMTTFDGSFAPLTAYFLNMDKIGMAHRPETYMSWLLVLEDSDIKL